MTGAGLGALLGLLGAGGVLLVLARLPFRRRRLALRVDPYLGIGVPSGAGRAGAARSQAQAFADGVAAAAGWFDRLVGGDASVRRRLEQLGCGSSEDFRISQLTWAVVAVATALALGGLRSAMGGGPGPVLLLVAALMAGAAAALARDRVLTRSVARRHASMLSEFPAVADLLALSVTAGEGPLGALQRVAGSCRGELAAEFRRTVAVTRSGQPLVAALEELADRTGVPALRRFVDGVVVAVERGTPLADVLRAQAADVREASRHALIETAARKEVVMMVPVVFLVLPTAVVFAMFPGFYGLSLAAP